MIASAVRVAERSARRALLCGLALLAGCAGGGSVDYYLIDVRTDAPLRAPARALSVEIIDVEVPQYLERFQLARRIGDNRLSYSSAHQWGEPLRKNLTRVLAEHLGTLLATPAISTPHNRLASVPDVRVGVHLMRFEADADGRVRLAARWELIDGGTGGVLATDAVEFRGERALAAHDPAAYVAALEDAFADLGVRIAQSIAAHVEDGGGGA